MAVYGARRRKEAKEWSEPLSYPDTPYFPLTATLAMFIDPSAVALLAFS